MRLILFIIFGMRLDEYKNIAPNVTSKYDYKQKG